MLWSNLWLKLGEFFKWIRKVDPAAKKIMKNWETKFLEVFSPRVIRIRAWSEKSPLPKLTSALTVDFTELCGQLRLKSWSRSQYWSNLIDPVQYQIGWKIRVRAKIYSSWSQLAQSRLSLDKKAKKTQGQKGQERDKKIEKGDKWDKTDMGTKGTKETKRTKDKKYTGKKVKKLRDKRDKKWRKGH